MVDISSFGVNVVTSVPRRLHASELSVIDFKVRPGRPVLIKVTNNGATEHGFYLTDTTTQAAPTAVNAKLVLKPGESKYIGIPTSDLFYATMGNTLGYRCHLHPTHVGGKLVMLK